PNGSGKTTTLKLLLGLMFPTSGRVRVFGQSPRSMKVKKDIGFLPEESYLYRFLNADEMLDFYGRLMGMDRKTRQRRIEEVLDLVGLKEARKRRTGEYSKGMSRRIGMAQVLLKDPKLVILDEPTIGLDPMGAKEMKDVIIRMKETGKTVILSSHLLMEIQNITDRIGILFRGDLIKVDSVDNLLTIGEKWTVNIKGDVSDEVREKVASVVKESGAQIESIDHPKESLESLFVKIIREKEMERE
ncbi:MAG: ABC transporter ATP-binding protein, partial [Thermoplasmata archaeon]|nr:ABC transporter ATP-binding protein [Thermoplasmata archaeon]